MSRLTINASGLNILAEGQGLVNGAARRIATGELDPKDLVDLANGRALFEAGTKVLQIEDEMNRPVLNVLG